MRIVLLWRHIGDRGQDLDPERVAANLLRLYSPLFSTVPSARVAQNGSASLVFLELPVRGWTPPFFQEDAHTCALAVDYPIDAHTVLAADDGGIDHHNVLPALCRRLQEDSAGLVREMAPPFSLMWYSKQTGETFVQNDGLGQSQLFEFQDARIWALTNKITALGALDVPLEVDPEQWAVRSTLGWFPLDMTGYKRVRFFSPATQLRLDANGVTRTTHDVLSEWVHPERMSQTECLELARWSLIKQIRAVMPLWEKPTVGLSGGWDSRAVVSSLRTAGARFAPRVRGLPDRPDVLVASQLARIAGLDLKVKHSAGLPPDDPDACRRRILLALLWQAGYMVTHKHKTFLPSLDGGAVNVMGQHGEIGRAFYAHKIQAPESREDRYEEHLVERLMEKMPPFTRTALHELVGQVIRDAYRQADRYDLEGIARLDFFYLYERTRRWASASLASQTGLVFAPFLNPDYIRAVFAFSGQGKETNPFHRYIIATNSPDWANVPYSEDFEERELPGKSADLVKYSEQKHFVQPDWRHPKGKYNYDSTLYWQMVGTPIIDEALARGGFWTQIFDPDTVRKLWPAAPDVLAIAHLLPEILH